MPYPKLRPPVETELYKALKEKFGDISALRRVFLFAKEATSELGIYTPIRYFDGILTVLLPQAPGVRIVFGALPFRRQKLIRWRGRHRPR